MSPDAHDPAVEPPGAEPTGGGERGYDRFAASLVGRWAAFATRAPCAAVEQVGEATAAIFPAAPTRALFNNALLAHAAADPAATLLELRRAYARAGVARFALWLPADDHATLAAGAAAGWRIADTTLAMHTHLPAAAADAAPRTGASAVATPVVGAPTDAAPGVGALTDVTPGIGAPTDAAPAAAAVEQVVETAEICALNGVDADLLPAWPERARAYLVRDGGGRALSAAVATRHDDDCALSFVATRPDARRQGHAGRIVARLLADAAADGCTSATLSATAAAERLYRALGFSDLRRMVMLAPR